MNNLTKSMSKLFATRRVFFKSALIVILVLLLVYICKNYIAVRMGFNANREHGSNGENTKKEANLIFFYADWCPHCKVAKPEWDKLKSENEGKQIGEYDVVYTEYNCVDPTSDVESLMSKYDVKGYPTVKLVKDGDDVIDFDAKPTSSTLNQFLNQFLA